MDGSITQYDELLASVETIMKKLSYNVEITHLDREEPTVIFIMYKEYRYNRIGSLVIRIREDMLKTGRVTRNTQEQLHNTFYISDISVDERYQGKGVGSLLLIYGMCYLKINNPNIVYVTLDDVSKHRKRMRDNFYGTLGFVTESHTAIRNSDSNLADEEDFKKLLNIESDFITRAKAKISKIMRNAGIKSQKTKNKKQKTKNKKQKTKKQKTKNKKQKTN